MKKILLLSAAAATLSVSLAHAQDTAPETTPAPESGFAADTIIVTVQKREQSIEDVPAAVTAYDQETLDALGVQQFDDLADFVPGLEVQEQSANNPGFVIRGITSDSGEANIEPRISIYKDGVSIARSRGSFVELLDSSVEVIRGPQPTLFGRSALIGAINIVSNKPEFGEEISGSARVGMGSLNYQLAEAMLNIPASETFAARGAFRWKQRDGYVDNLIGEDLNGYETAAFRGALRFMPSDALDININADHQVDDNPGTAFKSGTFLPAAGGSIDPWDAAALNAFGGIEDGRDLGLERTVSSVTGLVDYDINDIFSLSSVTNYREFDSSEVFDPDGFAAELFAFAENAKSEQWSQELRLDFANGPLTGFLGGSYFEEDGYQNVPLYYNEAVAGAFLNDTALFEALAAGQAPAEFVFANLMLFTDLPGVAQTAQQIPGAPLGYFNEEFTNYGETQSWDLFADASYQLTDRLEVTGGMRYTRDEKTSGYSANADGVSALTGAGLFAGGAIFNANNPIYTEDEFDGITWRAAANYALTDEITLFGNTARGRRPEVLAYQNDTSTIGLDPDSFVTIDAEEVDAFEGGVKTNLLGGALYGDASIYYYDYTNFQTSIIDDNGVIQPINAGNASATGFEGTLFARPAGWVDLFAVYAYSDASFDDEDDDGNPQAFGGNTFRLQPEHAYSLGATFSSELGFGLVEFTPVWSWKSEVFFDNDNDRTDLFQDEAQDAYGLLDLRLTYTAPNDAFGVEVFVENALDEEYIIDAGNTGDGFGIPTFIAGAPRTAGVYLSKDF